jgi:hypothetical protein
MHQALKTTLQYHGIRGLFKGLSSTLLRDVPFSGILILIFVGCYTAFFRKNIGGYSKGWESILGRKLWTDCGV